MPMKLPIKDAIRQSKKVIIAIIIQDNNTGNPITPIVVPTAKASIDVAIPKMKIVLKSYFVLFSFLSRSFIIFIPIIVSKKNAIK